MNKDVYENYVCQIAKEGSLTKAAEKLGISQPALSSGLTAFEKKLGFQVFNRGQSPVVLTQEGQIYIDYLNRKKVLTSDFLNRIEAYRGTREQHVSIGTPVVYSESIVANAVYRLLEQYPEYSVLINTAPLSGLIDSMENGELDCLISTSGNIPQNFEKKEIKQEQIFLCVPKFRAVNNQIDNTLKTAEPAAIFTLLRDEPFILLEKSQPIQLLVNSFLVSRGIHLHSHITVDQVATAVNLAAMGLGCCFASEDALYNVSVRENLFIYSLSGFIPERPIYAVYHKEFYHSQACKELIRCLTE